MSLPELPVGKEAGMPQACASTIIIDTRDGGAVLRVPWGVRSGGWGRRWPRVNTRGGDALTPTPPFLRKSFARLRHSSARHNSTKTTMGWAARGHCRQGGADLISG
jgi:hypothetical protein